MSDPLKFPHSLGDEASEDRLAELLGDYIDRINAGELVVESVISSEHPEEAASVIRDFSEQELARLSSLEDVTSPYEIMIAGKPRFPSASCKRAFPRTRQYHNGPHVNSSGFSRHPRQ